MGRGRPAVDKHLEYYRHTGMDFVKIQFETVFPPQPEIERPEDWSKLPRYGLDVYRDQLEIVGPQQLVDGIEHRHAEG